MPIIYLKGRKFQYFSENSWNKQLPVHYFNLVLNIFFTISKLPKIRDQLIILQNFERKSGLFDYVLNIFAVKPVFIQLEAFDKFMTRFS